MGYAMESLSVSLAYCAIADPLSCIISKGAVPTYTVPYGLDPLQRWYRCGSHKVIEAAAAG